MYLWIYLHGSLIILVMPMWVFEIMRVVRMTFFAIREIEFGEELLWDYEASEYEVSAFETCLCGSSKCRKVLGGFKMSGETIRDLYGEYYANYLKDR
mmetsp:Transcript_9838/g.14556  ORF Transcript_9838/g.14556 Transcript_9838/m.14556 type:complete len:97 (-) Transcript_9838:342-632(-)